MAWIEFHAARVKRLQKFRDFRVELGWSVNEALGFLGNFWSEVIELREDGDIYGWKPDYVAEVTNVRIAPEKLWDALVRHKWIEPGETKVLLHDWLDTAARYLEGRYHSADPGRLVAIWEKHGRVYELSESQKRKGGPKADYSPPKGDPPNQTQPYQTNQQQRPSSGQGRPARARKAREPYSEAFEAFWAVYPRKDAKVAAWAAWQRAKVAPEDLERILGAVRSKAATPDWTKEGGRYVPLPTTYLNQRRWEDQGTAVKDPLRPSAAPSKYDNLTEVV